MSRITALRMANRSRQNDARKTTVFVDGRPVFTVETEAVVNQGLHVGQELSPEKLEVLTREGHFYRCLSAAMHFLSYRPRSEYELRQRLIQRGFHSDIIEAVIARLQEQSLVDDIAFARFWKENRDTFSPRSQWLTGLELRRKGVSDDIISAVASEVDDDDSAYRAALSRGRRLSTADYQTFHRRLGDFLKRRGFGYGVITRTVQRMWHETGQLS